MGIPIPDPELDPLQRLKGYFVDRPTDCPVGLPRSAVLAAHSCHRHFLPLLRLDGGLLRREWEGAALHFVYGGLGEGGGEQSMPLLISFSCFSVRLFSHPQLL
jgi:hypothetical protein